MKSFLKEKIIFSKRDILYVFECPELKESVRSGQFFEVHVRDGLEPFLRRPISIFDVSETQLSFLVRTVGTGTKLMSEWEIGQEADLLGPLGNGFQFSDDHKDILLIGGGIGVAPFYLLIKELLHQGKNVTLLFLPEKDREILEAFGGLKDKIKIEYAKNRANLPVILKELLAITDMIYTCGPMNMMQRVTEIAREFHIPSQVSLESRMACGIGVCMGCVIPVKNGDNDFVYKRVCREGPVFDGEEVIFQ